MLPFAAELETVIADSPAQVICDREAAQVAALRRVEVVTQREIDRVEVKHLRPSEAEAIAINITLTGGWDIPVLPVVIREAEIIDHSFVYNTGDVHQVLVNPVLVRDEIGWRHRYAERPAVGISDMRITDEHRLLVIEAVIHSAADLPAHIRRRGDRSKPRDRPQVGLYDIDALLIRIFIVSEEVELVFFDRPAENKPARPTGEERIVREVIARQARIGRHVVIAEAEKGRPVKIIAAAARYDVDRAERRDAGGKIEVRARKLELLHDLLRKVLPRAAFDRIADIAAIHSDGRVRSRAAQHRDVELRVELGGVAELHGDAGFQLGEV